MKISLICGILISLLLSAVHSADAKQPIRTIEGTVTKVSDGDTLQVYEKNNQQSELNNAIDDYNKALELKTSSVFTLSNGCHYRSQAYMAKFRVDQSSTLLDKALNDINKAITLDSQNPVFIDSRVSVYLVKKDYAKAFSDFIRSEQLKKAINSTQRGLQNG